MATNMSSGTVVHEVLTEDNYANWNACVKNYLLSQDLWDIVETESKEENEAELQTWKRKNATALHAIQISCGPDILSQIREFSSAKSAWDFLSKLNEPQSEGVSEREKPQSEGEISEPEKPQSEEVSEPEMPHLEGEVNEPEKSQSEEICEPKKPQSEEEINQPESHSGAENINYDPLLKAVDSGDWEAAKSFLHDHPGAQKARISEEGGTALHVAAIAGHKKIVKELVHLMSEEDLELRTEYYGYTALHSAAANSGIAQIAECIVEKNKKLVSIEDRYGLIPVVVAATRGRYDVMRWLYSLTPLEDLYGRKGATLLVSCINGSVFEVALDLLQRCPRLAFLQDLREWRFPVRELANCPSAFPSGSRLVFWQRWIYSYIGVQPADFSNYLRIDVQNTLEGQRNIVKAVFGQLHGLLLNLLKPFGIKQIYETKLRHVQALQLLRLICEQIPTLSSSQLEHGPVNVAFFDAVRHGVVEFIMEITRANPTLLRIFGERERNIFHWATIHRQEKIFSLIYALDSRKDELASAIDRYGNNMLHSAGRLAPSNRLDQISGAALQMRSELLWFKEVENVIPPKLKGDTNKDGKTPREVFVEEHRELLREGERWMKDMAGSCAFVAALIVTIAFAAAITIPGGNDQVTGIPLLLKKKLFMVYAVSNAMSFSSSSTSVLIFLGILTARYGEEYFIKSLPTKMILGLTTLFLSIAAMMITFCTALFLILHGQSSSVFVSIILLAAFPIIIFAWLQFPLLVELIISTYGPAMFDRNTKRWY